MSTVSALSSLLGSSSSSSIDISSILEAALGASSPGLDVTSAVNSAVTAAQAPEQAWETQESTIQSQESALSSIQTAATSLDNDVQQLNSLTGPLSARTVSSSNSNIVSASAASGTTQANHVIVVNNLATTDSWTSGTVASATTDLSAGSFTITSGSGASTTITTNGSQSLTDVVNEINGDNLGVTASVVTDATGARLAIESNTSGSAAAITVSGDINGESFTHAVTGTNASLTVDGISIQSASNTVTGALSGVTLNLLSASPGTEVSLAVAPDVSAATTAINQFVTDYNTVIGDINAQYADTGSGEGVLGSDSTLRSLQSELLQSLGYTYVPSTGTTTVSNLSSLGISVNNDGSLSVDSATLNTALTNNFSDVQSFFQGAALNGFANTLDQQLTSFISPADGAFTLDLQSLSTQYTSLQTDISNFETNYITPLKTQLQNEYSQAEIDLQQLPNETKQIDAELGENSSSS
jgi:flagellar hook-associated protein 2